MDPRLKERLIGAAVLVALGVWLIPWILDGPDRQPAQTETEPAVVLPSQPDESAPLRTRTDDLGGRPGAAAAAPETAVADNAAAAPNDPDTDAAGEPPAPQLSEPVVARTRDVRGVAAPGALRPPPNPEPESRTVAGRIEAGDWVVQLGSFSEQDNAERLAARVTTHGFEPAVSVFRAGGQPMYRVRVGPYDSRGRADETASTLAANGFVAQVVDAN